MVFSFVKSNTISLYWFLLQLPKYWLKSKDFQEQCFFSSIELLCMHFDQWSHHISLPELATAPLIRLRKFCETTTDEHFKRAVKRFIDQVYMLSTPLFSSSLLFDYVHEKFLDSYICSGPGQAYNCSLVALGCFKIR